MKIFFTIFVFIVLWTPIFSQARDTSFANTGMHNYIVPSGYKTTIRVEVIGAGGAMQSSLQSRGGGGGGGFGSYTYGDIPAGSYSLYVGASESGAVKADSSFFVGPEGTLIAYGGARGTTSPTTSGGAGGSAAGPSGGIYYTGGNGGNRYQVGLDSIGGGGGAAASALGNGANGTNASPGMVGIGGTGVNNSGSGSNGTLNQQGLSASAGVPGGGRGGYGSRTTNSSGVGSKGVVRVIVVSSVLPISLIDFQGIFDQTVNLSWQTASESNNDHFEIQRSREGEIFIPIGKVKSAGNSNALQSYDFVDESPLSGVNYYRLKQTDFDGTFSYSKVITVDNTNKVLEEIKVYPSNTQSGQNIYLDLHGVSQGTYNLEISDMTGRLFTSSSINTAQTKVKILETNKMVKGTYIARLSVDQKTTYTARFIVH